MTVSAYLLTRLRELGVEHAFGIPGDYVLPFFDELLDAPHGVQHIMPCNELNGSYMADGYAKRRGFGAMAVTFGPGCLSAINGVAGAFADDVPMVLVCGTPASGVLAKPTERLLHHAAGTNLDAFLEMFRPVTVRSERVARAEEAAALIDDVLRQSYVEKKPCYLEIPYDVQFAEVSAPAGPLELARALVEAGLRAALGRAAGLLGRAKTRSVVAGHLVFRQALSEEVLGLVSRLGASCASTFGCKDGNFESSEQAVGIYSGRMSKDEVRVAIEGEDPSHVCLAVGLTYNEFDTGVFTSQLGKHNLITIGHDQVVINGDVYHGVFMADFVRELIESCNAIPVVVPPRLRSPSFHYDSSVPLQPTADDLTVDRMMLMFAHYFRAGDVLFGDAGGMINASQCRLPLGVKMFGNGNWASIGAGFGTLVGASFTTSSQERLIGVLGDGALQMSAQEVSTLLKYRRDAALFVLNNAGYAAERAIHPGKYRSYNDVQNWSYHLLGEAFGAQDGQYAGFEVRTELELDSVLATLQVVKGVNIVNVHLDPDDLASFNKDFSEKLRH